MDISLATRLARRTGFGADRASALAALDVETAVARMLSADRTATVPTYEPVAPLGQAATKADRSARNKQLGTQLADVTAWWLRRMASAPEPFVEKLTFVWHGHFATSAQKVRSASEMAGQNAFLRTHATGDFHTLAYGMLVDPAMLRWLDGVQNTAAAPNENLARESMELFMLGHGDTYTENDVREGARALTGWTITGDGAAVLRDKRHDSGSKTVLGVTGDLDAAGYCNAVLAQPGSARYVASRLWAQLVSGTPPSSAVLDRLVIAYGSGRSVSALITAMLTAPEFAAAKGTSVANPVEWMLGAVRALTVPLSDDATVRKVAEGLRTLGQLPFYPPSVGGWPSGQAWLSTAAADARLQMATTLAKAADLPDLGTSSTSRVEAVGHLIGVPAWTDRSAGVLTAVAGDPANLVAAALNTPENLSD